MFLEEREIGIPPEPVVPFRLSTQDSISRQSGTHTA